MMTSIVQQNTEAASTTRVVPPSVLLIGKKRAVDYISPGLLRLNNTGELIIRATGSLSIVTAVDVAELIKRDVENALLQTISLGTDSLVISTGESKRMSCIEIKLSKPLPSIAEQVMQVQVQEDVGGTNAEITAPSPKKKTRVTRKKKTVAVKKKKSAKKRRSSR
jgi:DNA-binding protein Alba